MVYCCPNDASGDFVPCGAQCRCDRGCAVALLAFFLGLIARAGDGTVEQNIQRPCDRSLWHDRGRTPNVL